jgi:hypothetical protein
MDRFEHLDPDAAVALSLPTADRVVFCRTDRWIGYSRAEQIGRQLDDLYVYPKSLRMPNILLVGRSNNGKSSIIREFIGRHPMQRNDDGTAQSGVLWMGMPAKPTETSFWSELLGCMLLGHRERDPIEKKRHQAYHGLNYLGIRVIAIDEFNHLTNAGKHAAAILASIKNLSTDLKVAIIATGTQAAINALNSDMQMKTRFEPLVLDRWTMNAEYLRFLASYERLLPLAEPSNLATRELAPKIWALGGDTIGGTVNTLQRAAVLALHSGKEKIDASILGRIGTAAADQWTAIAQRA